MTSYKIVLATSFKASVRKLKRFRNVKDDVKSAIAILLEEPRLGDVIPGGFGVRKLRVINSDISKGKRSGYRLIYLIEDEPTPTIYLLFLYFKSDRSDISVSEIQQLLKELADET